MHASPQRPALAGSRALALSLLALANLFWAGNWVLGRVLRDAFDPVTLNLLRWAGAALVLAPFALPGVLAAWGALRRRAGVLFMLALTGVALFQSLVYLGLRTTTTVNAVLLNSSGPLFMLLCSWVIEREHGTRRQVAGMLISLVGILIILSRGRLGSLLALDVHGGDAWILLAMPMWGIYSVLLKRRPPELGGVEFLFVIALGGVILLAPFAALEAVHSPPHWPGTAAAAGVVYVALFASVGAFICWNRGVAIVGANTAGFTLHLLPAFGAVLAMIFIGERFYPFHAAGIVTILVGVIVATGATELH
jgi:drug/metabolite transporter (DMT)-like permease